jgi:hypothetical protein
MNAVLSVALEEPQERSEPDGVEGLDAQPLLPALGVPVDLGPAELGHCDTLCTKRTTEPTLKRRPPPTIA